ncbi:HNH endonuclease [Halostagnicola bangensis]
MQKEVFDRDEYRCQRCGTKNTPSNLNVHHIQPVKDGGETEPENLVTLCEDCHERSHRYNEEMLEEMPDRSIAAFTFRNASLNDYVSDLDKHLNESEICIPVHIREPLYAVISVEGEEMSQAVNCWHVDLQPEQRRRSGMRLSFQRCMPAPC